MTLHVKSGGAWREVLAPSVCVAGSWRTVTGVWIKVAGVWKQVLPNPSQGGQTFTSDGSYVVPAGVYSITYQVTGGGAGGGSGCARGTDNYNGQVIEGGGGGSSGTYYTGTLAVTPGETLTIYVGIGGAGGAGVSGYSNGNWGSAGGTSAVYRGGTPLVTAAGGNGGYPGVWEGGGSWPSYGLGGASAGPNSNAGYYSAAFTSGPSEWGPLRYTQYSGTNTAVGGRGADSVWGGGGGEGGISGSAYGAGGGGSSTPWYSNPSGNGGSGYPGSVIITPDVTP